MVFSCQSEEKTRFEYVGPPGDGVGREDRGVEEGLKKITVAQNHILVLKF